MTGGHRSKKGAAGVRLGKTGRRGAHRAKSLRPEPYAWLGAGAVTLGLGAALVGGTGIAYADEGSTESSSSTGSQSTGQQPPGAKDSQDSPADSAPATDSPDPDAENSDSSAAEIDSDGGPADELEDEAEEQLEDDPEIEEVDPDTEFPAQDPEATPSVESKSLVHKIDSNTSTETETADTGTQTPAGDDDLTAASFGSEPPSRSARTAVTVTQTTADLQSSTTATVATAAATPAATAPPPAFLSVPVLKLVAGVLNALGFQTNTPLPPLDLQGAAVWLWFRDLQEQWGIKPPTQGVQTTGEPDPATGTVIGRTNAKDPAKLPLTYTVATDPLLGTVTFNNKAGTFTYTPTVAARIAAMAVPATDIFTVTVSNGLSSIYQVVTVNIDAASPMPTSPILVSHNADNATGRVTGTVRSDPQAAPLSYSVLTSPVGGSLEFNADGTFTYQPSITSMGLAYLGLAYSDAFIVTSTNGIFTSLPNIITVPIVAQNASPSVPTTVTQSTNLHTGTVTGSVGSTDPHGQDLTYTVVTATMLGALSFDGATGAYTYQPSAAARLSSTVGMATTDAFTVVARNADFVSAITTINVPIAPNNIPSNPAKASQTVDTNSGLVTGTLGATDPAGAPLTYTLVINPVFGSASVTPTGGFTYTPTLEARYGSALGITTTDGFTVQVSNGLFSAVGVIAVPISPKTVI